MMYARRQAADHRNATQVQEIQRQSRHGAVPMDVSALVAAIERLRESSTESNDGVSEYSGSGATQSSRSEELSPLDQVLAALKGKGKGKGPGKESRECYNCGKKGHLARDCWAPKKNEKEEESKGKGKGVKAVEEVAGGTEEEATISLGGLTIATKGSVPLQSVSARDPEEKWRGYVKVRAMVDSGAAACVCGAEHFDSVPVIDGKNGPNSQVEYVCADGGRIPNLGEKPVRSLTSEGGKLNVKFQVTQVDRPLISVSDIASQGHSVLFGKDGGVIVHGATGARTRFTKERGVYLLDLWVPPSAGGRRQ
jgi:hypothetical protein